MYPFMQTFLTFGLSKSGTAAAEYLLRESATVYLYDDLATFGLERNIRGLERLGARRISKEELSKIQETCDAVVLSPGIPIDHPVPVAFRRAGKAVLGEAELAARVLRCSIVAVTGTNGKTTTVSMLEKIFVAAGKKAEVCGNVGSPMINQVEASSNDVAIAEISSFQLETLNSLRPHAAVVLNLTEDHLNRHYNMENYVFLKKKILKNLTETEYAVLNYDDGTVREFETETRAKIIYFSLREKVRGAYVQEKTIYYLDEKIMNVDKLALPGVHNVQNALAAICVAKLYGISSETIARCLSEFKGVKHRIEKVALIDGVCYVDDSKATNVDATMKAVEAIKGEIILLLGGKDKGYDYDKLFVSLQNSSVVKCVLYGENRLKLLESALRVGYASLSLCDNFTFAVNLARLTANAGQTILLSPASASFDEFTGFEERGDKFVEIIAEFKKSERVDSTSEEDSLDDERSESFEAERERNE